MPDFNPRYTNEQTGYEVYLCDGADLLTDGEEEELIKCMEPVTQYGNAAFESQYVTGQSSHDYMVEHYSDFFEESGTLFLIDMGNRQLKLYSSEEVYKTVTTSYANSITDNVYTFAAGGDYFTCAKKVFEQETILLRGGHIAQPMKYISCALMALIIALLINYFLVRFKSRNTKTPQAKIMAAVAASAMVGSAATYVTRRERHKSSSSGGSHGGGGGGGGSSFGGGGHSF